MNLKFTKYQATGNDFILIDNRDGKIILSQQQIVQLCDRKFGIGADGLILIEPSDVAPFNVNYYNSDGSQSLCGNGSRAAVSFAASLTLLKDKTSFIAYDGLHDAELMPSGIVRLRMNDTNAVDASREDLFANTGSPHVIRFVNNIQDYPVFEEGKKVRYNDAYKPGGTNVNFVELQDNNALFVRTYERGVENETLSCGTGVTAAALAASTKGYTSPIQIKTLGGELSVTFKKGVNGEFTDIYLIGPAQKVFEGEIVLP
ncbi:diaminopimelate epimerase [Chryseotalea sanaruensis]|uniref:Diaminopimelate epimerase n=1 Tax=Chryseotalea sanaruensis TaxID=2482724 RepID=A0A401U7I4_9BACT|nr:diaminopimelate epimerase [Chryseotalea sanaruensis]GCC50848.1 diaminopimelate epimerase [Chryseotalea sanaruensis]